MSRSLFFTLPALCALVFIALTGTAAAKSVTPEDSRYGQLADTPFPGGYPADEDITRLKTEIFFQRAVQSYIWALPALNMRAMQEAKAEAFGPGCNIMPIWKDRMNSKTLITTPNSDVIYALNFLNLKSDGPMVVEVPPGIQGIVDDAFQRPVCSEGEINGKIWCGDIGLPGPDQGKGGKYLLLPPDYKGSLPGEGYLTFRARTYNVMLLWRAFFHDPAKLEEPVKALEQTRIYPLAQAGEPKAMEFPNASQKSLDMLYPKDGKAFDMLARIIAEEYADPQDMEMRGMLAAIGIRQDKEFKPDAARRELLDKAAKTASKFGYVVSYTPQDIEDNGLWYKDRRWLNVFPGNAEFTAPTFNYIDPRTGFFTNAFTASPGMAVTMENVGAKYPATFVDSQGKFLLGGNSYSVTLPKDIPAKLFWSLTVYDSLTASLVDNGRPFASINSMDRPIAVADGSTEVYFGPESPGKDKNWIRTVPGKGFFVILRLYGPEKAFFDQTWKPGDLEPVK